MKQKKYICKKKNFTRENLIEFSILFIMIFYSGAIKDNIEKLSKIQFSDAENENFKKFLIKLLGENKAEKELEGEAFKFNPNLSKSVYENTNLKMIVNKKNYDQIKEVFEDLINDHLETENKKRIESLEKKLINNMEENVYTELLKLKSQINRD